MRSCVPKNGQEKSFPQGGRGDRCLEEKETDFGPILLQKRGKKKDKCRQCVRKPGKEKKKSRRHGLKEGRLPMYVGKKGGGCLLEPKSAVRKKKRRKREEFPREKEIHSRQRKPIPARKRR